MTEFKNSNYKYNENYGQNIEKLQRSVSEYERKLINGMNKTIEDVDNFAIKEQRLIHDNQEYLQSIHNLNSIFIREFSKLEHNLTDKIQQAVREMSEKIQDIDRNPRKKYSSNE